MKWIFPKQVLFTVWLHNRYKLHFPRIHKGFEIVYYLLFSLYRSRDNVLVGCNKERYFQPSWWTKVYRFSAISKSQISKSKFLPFFSIFLWFYTQKNFFWFSFLAFTLLKAKKCQHEADLGQKHIKKKWSIVTIYPYAKICLKENMMFYHLRNYNYSLI